MGIKNQIKWDGENSSGYVLNQIYTKGYVFEDILLKPDLGYDYESVDFDQTRDIYQVTVNGIDKVLTAEDKINLLNVCTRWVDTTYFVEKTFDDEKTHAKEVELILFNKEVIGLGLTAPSHEIASWPIQLEEAKAWNADNLFVTIFIDKLLLARANGETKQELVDKILTKSEAYTLTYSNALGNYYRVIANIDAATTPAELSTVWA